MVSHTEERWRWGTELIACFDDLKWPLSQRTPPILDKEVIPDFGGSPDGLVLWVICDRHDDVASLEAQHADLTQLFQAQMTKRDFPASAVSSLRLFMTSREDIDLGGGRFAFFR